jgi:iron complex transport system substrate-binding protein
VVALNPTSLDDIFEDIRRVGQATDCARAAERIVSQLRGRVDAVAEKTRTLSAKRRPRVICIEWIEPLMLAANWMPRLIELAGGENGLTQGNRHSTYGNWEQVVRYDPDVILLAPCGFDLQRTVQEAEVLATWPDWAELTAVNSQRVYALDGNAYFNRSGPRIVDSLEILAHLLHPTLFSPPVHNECDAPWHQFHPATRLQTRPMS